MLKRWLIQSKNLPPKESYLPDPRKADTPEKAERIVSANESVEKQIVSSSSKKRKRGDYNHYDSEQKLKIAKYACEHGLSKAVKYFNSVFEKPINESTIRTFKKGYLLKIKTQSSDSDSEICMDNAAGN